MSFNNTADDWVKHSVNMLFVSQFKTFIEEEMACCFDCDGIDVYNEDKQYDGTDIGSKKSKSIEPNFLKELELIAEVLPSSGMFVETNNRVMCDNIIWNTLPWLKKVLSKDTSSEKSNEPFNVTVSETEWDKIGLLSDFSSTDDQLNVDKVNQEESFNNTNIGDISNSIQNLTYHVNADEDENETSTSSQNVTIELAVFCTQNASVKILPIFNKYKFDCHKHAAALLHKNDYVNKRLKSVERNKR